MLWDIVFVSCPVPLAVVNADFQFEVVNDAFCQLLKRSRSQLLLRSFQEVTRAEDVGPDLSLADKVRRGDLPGYSLVKAYLAPDWSLVWVQVGVQSYFEDGELVCFYVSAIPVDAPVTAKAVQPARAAGATGWLSENFWRWLPYALAALGASYTVYAKFAVQRAESESLKQRLEQLEKHTKP